jgi:hypothetical protein
MQWEAWRREVNNLIIGGAFVGDQHCLQLAELLAGDNKAQKFVFENSEDWYKHIVSFLTYWEPSVLTYQLGDHARASLKMYESNRPLDKILLALFDADFYQVCNHYELFSQ